MEKMPCSSSSQTPFSGENEHVKTPGCACYSQSTEIPKPTQGGSKLKSAFSVLLGIGVAFFPKCPFCWAAYMSVFSALGLGSIPYQPWMLPVLAFLLLVNIAVLFYNAKHRNGYGPVLSSLLGIVLIFIGKFVFETDTLLYVGLAVVLLGSVWNALPKTGLLAIRHWSLAFLGYRQA